MRQTALTIELDNVVSLEAAETVQQSTVPVFILFSIVNLLQKLKHSCIWKMNAKDGYQYCERTSKPCELSQALVLTISIVLYCIHHLSSLWGLAF